MLKILFWKPSLQIPESILLTSPVLLLSVLLLFSRDCHDLSCCAWAASVNQSLVFPFPTSVVCMFVWLETPESSSAVAWFLICRICHSNLEYGAPQNTIRFFFFWLIILVSGRSPHTPLLKITAVTKLNSWVLQEHRKLVLFCSCFLFLQQFLMSCLLNLMVSSLERFHIAFVELV